MSKMPDFSQMTKEEVVAYFTSQMAAEKSKRDDAEANSQKVILNLRKELTQAQKAAEIAQRDHVKIQDFKTHCEALIANLISAIREHEKLLAKYLDVDDYMTLPDAYNFNELNMFFESTLEILFGAVKAVMRHQEVSLKLGTSEKNRGESPAPDYSADEKAEASLKAENLSAEGEVDVIENDDSVPSGTEVELGCIPAPASGKDASPASASEDKAKTSAESTSTSETPPQDTSATSSDKKKQPEVDKQITEAVLKECHSKSGSIATELGKQTELLKSATLKLNNDTSSLNDSRRKARDTSFISVKDGEQIAGIIDHSGTKQLRAYCIKCKTVMTFKLVASRKRINNIMTVVDGLNDLGTVLAPVQNAECTGCGLKFEYNPASMVDIEAIRNSNKSEQSTPEDEAKQIQNATQTAPTTAESQSQPSNSSDEDSVKAPDTQPLDQSKASDNQAQSNGKAADNQPQSKSRADSKQKELRSIFTQIKNTQNAETTSQVIEDILENLGRSKIDVINPLKFNANIFGMSPAFTKSKVSVALLCALGTQFSMLGAPKNRLYNYYEGCGLTISREQLTAVINAFARAYLHPVCEQIRKDIVKNTTAIIMDESTLYVRETANRKIKEGKGKKSQIWTLNPSWTSEFKAAWFTVSDSRSASNVIDILGNEVNNNDVLKYLISDGYTGYDSALKILRASGIDITSCRCVCHGRRQIHYYLKNNGFLDIYNRYLIPKGAAFSDFEENLKKYRKTEEGKKLTDRTACMLTIYYLINALFVIDSAVVRKHQFVCNTEEFKSDLQRARTDYSSKIIDAVFDCVRIFIAKNPNVMHYRISKDGKVLFSQNKRCDVSKALIYLLKYEKNLREFVKSPDIELTSSAAERSLKLGICARHAFMFLQSEDGAHAFANYQTIINTCNLNRVPVQHYLLWLVANIKVRMNMKIAEGKDDPSFFTMPGKKKLVDDPKKGTYTTLNMYDKANKYGADSIDMTGLTPYDYRAYLEQQLS